MSSLIIPMLVEAYATGCTNTTQKDVPLMAPDYKTALFNSVLGSRNTPGISEKTKPLEAGVHLHFILPDAFTHSLDGQDYPAVPNRYVVTRIWRDTASDKLLSRCFAVESDFISTEKKYNNSITIPMFTDPDERKRWRYLGRCYDADNKPADTVSNKYLDKLTALGAGDPLFAAYYPNCKSVFGFYDDLKDLPAVPSVKITYFVMGYFSDTVNDPFKKVKTAGDFKDVLSTLNLSVGTDNEICDNCVLYGAIDALLWKGFEADYCPSPQGKVNVVVGNTSAEALSFAIRNCLEEETGFTERLLTALQYELYDEKEKYDGNFKIDDEIHLRSFKRLDGYDESFHLSVDKNTSLNSDIKIGNDYSDIKKSGSGLGALKRRLVYEQKKLYSVWEQYILLYEEDTKIPAGYPSKESLLDEIQAVLSRIRHISDDILDKSSAFKEQTNSYSNRLPDGVTCEKSGNEAFYTGKDPVVMLSGPGINRTYAFGEDGRFTNNGTLMCQTAAVASNIGKDEILKQCFSGLIRSDNLPVMYWDLLLQTALVCQETLLALKTILGQIEVTGEMPSEIAVNRDPFNWTTLYMIWEADYSPTNTVPDPDNTLADWDMEYGETNLVYKGGLKPEQLKKYSISGKNVLTPHAVKTLSSVVNRYVDIYEEEKDLKELAAKLKDLSIISQNLSGFSDYFSGFWHALQFPVFGIGEGDKITQMVADNIGDERQSILPDSRLMPMRGGYIKITGLTLVSSFGQTQPLIQSSYYNSCEVDFSEAVNCGIKDYGLLPPSFTVPTRLHADFVSAGNNDVYTSAAPETSPVCGILIPEMLNRRLLAYTADGNYLGMVKTVYRDGRPAARWLSAPNLSVDFDKLEIPDDRFKSFLKTLINAGHAFYEFNGLLDKYLDAKQNFGSLIWGRPLVLARLKMYFEFFGYPQFSKRFEDFKKYNTYRAENIRFQLEFGDMERVTDGLLGCFKDDGFTKMFSPFGAENPYSTEYYVQYSGKPDISNADGDRFFTLLLEPDSPVNIQTGILPVKTIHFEPSHARTAENLALSTEISPILATMGQVGLPPLPQTEENHSYKWYVLDNEEYEESKLIPPMVTYDETILMDGLIIKERS